MSGQVRKGFPLFALLGKSSACQTKLLALNYWKANGEGS